MSPSHSSVCSPPVCVWCVRVYMYVCVWGGWGVGGLSLLQITVLGILRNNKMTLLRSIYSQLHVVNQRSNWHSYLLLISNFVFEYMYTNSVYTIKWFQLPRTYSIQCACACTHMHMHMYTHVLDVP